MALDQIDLIGVLRDHFLHRLAELVERAHLAVADRGAAEIEGDGVEVDPRGIGADVLVLQHLVERVGARRRLDRRRKERSANIGVRRPAEIDDVAVARDADPRRRHVVQDLRAAHLVVVVVVAVVDQDDLVAVRQHPASLYNVAEAVADSNDVHAVRAMDDGAREAVRQVLHLDVVRPVEQPAALVRDI